MLEIRIEKDRNYKKTTILCNVLYAGFELFEDTLKTEKFSRKDYKELKKCLDHLGLNIYNICDILEKYDK